MRIENPVVSGSLGKAMFWLDGALKILNVDGTDPRDPLPNEAYWMRTAARRLKAVPVFGYRSIKAVRAELTSETSLFRAVDGLMIGMDLDLPLSLRRRAIQRANDQLLSQDSDFSNEVASQFLVQTERKQWDPKSALALATDERAFECVEMYRALVEGVVEAVADDIEAATRNVIGVESEATAISKQLLTCGVLGVFALAEIKQHIQELTPELAETWTDDLDLESQQLEPIIESICAHCRIRVRAGLDDGGEDEAPARVSFGAIETEPPPRYGSNRPPSESGRFGWDVQQAYDDLVEELIPIADARPTNLDSSALQTLVALKDIIYGGADKLEGSETILELCTRLLDVIDRIQVESPRRWVAVTSEIRKSVLDLAGAVPVHDADYRSMGPERAALLAHIGQSRDNDDRNLVAVRRLDIVRDAAFAESSALAIERREISQYSQRPYYWKRYLPGRAAAFMTGLGVATLLLPVVVRWVEALVQMLRHLLSN